MKFTVSLSAVVMATALMMTTTSTVQAGAYGQRGSPQRRADPAPVAPPPHFTYGSENLGPQNWGGISPLYELCAKGLQQSPIVLDTKDGPPPYVKSIENVPMKFNYHPIYNSVISYNGHAVQIDWNTTVATPPPKRGEHEKTSTTVKPNLANTITIGNNKTYTMAQFHFHSPSEHHILGGVNNEASEFAEAELHMVHKTAAGEIAVVGILLQVQKNPNPFFNFLTVLDKAQIRADHQAKLMGKQEAEVAKYTIPKVDFSSLLKGLDFVADRWEYDGSLTTPPCTEGVKWHVAKQAVGLGLEQFNALVDLEAFNARFVQSRPL